MENTGLRQDCCLSTTPFKVNVNEALRRRRKCCSGTDETTLRILSFDDEHVVIAQYRNDLEFMTKILITQYERCGLNVNAIKT